jgi:hypothetical protein
MKRSAWRTFLRGDRVDTYQNAVLGLGWHVGNAWKNGAGEYEPYARATELCFIPDEELPVSRVGRDKYTAREVPACQRCNGTGRRVYGSTAGRRGGRGGQVLTSDVCDACDGRG